MVKCLVCGKELEVGEEVYVTVDGYVCADCVVGRRFLEACDLIDEEDSEEE